MIGKAAARWSRPILHWKDAMNHFTVASQGHAAEDLCQEALLILVQSLRRKALRDHGALSSYVYGVCVILAAKSVKLRQRERATEAEVLDRPPAPGTEGEDGEAAAREILIRTALRRSFARLGERDRRALLLRYRHGLPFAKVALHLDVSYTAARQMVGRARDRLKDVLLASSGLCHIFQPWRTNRRLGHSGGVSCNAAKSKAGNRGTPVGRARLPLSVLLRRAQFRVRWVL